MKSLTIKDFKNILGGREETITKYVFGVEYGFDGWQVVRHSYKYNKEYSQMLYRPAHATREQARHALVEALIPFNGAQEHRGVLIFVND